jgi:hypothetical protein
MENWTSLGSVDRWRSIDIARASRRSAGRVVPAQLPLLGWRSCHGDERAGPKSTMHRD